MTGASFWPNVCKAFEGDLVHIAYDSETRGRGQLSARLIEITKVGIVVEHGAESKRLRILFESLIAIEKA